MTDIYDAALIKAHDLMWPDLVEYPLSEKLRADHEQDAFACFIMEKDAEIAALTKLVEGDPLDLHQANQELNTELDAYRAQVAEAVKAMGETDFWWAGLIDAKTRVLAILAPLLPVKEPKLLELAFVAAIRADSKGSSSKDSVDIFGKELIKLGLELRKVKS